MEGVVKEEKNRTRSAVQKGKVWETRALTATEQAQAAEAHLERLNQDIRELNATKEGGCWRHWCFPSTPPCVPDGLCSAFSEALLAHRSASASQHGISRPSSGFARETLECKSTAASLSSREVRVRDTWNPRDCFRRPFSSLYWAN